jgi:hypothetical protein
MNAVNPDKSPLDVLGTGAGISLLQTTTAILKSVGSSVTAGLAPTIEDVFSTANRELLSRVLNDNPGHRDSSGLSLSEDSIFLDNGNQSIVASTSERNVDPAGTPNAVRVTGNQGLDIAMREGIESATGRKAPPVNLVINNSSEVDAKISKAQTSSFNNYA